MKAWAQGWMESEAGWGTRHDGYSVCATREESDTHTKELVAKWRAMEAADGYGPNRPPADYSYPDGAPCEIEVSAETMARIAANKGVLWTPVLTGL